jgi:2'-deoxynucleoside 5'-phosphate N-hydrolase
MQEIYFSTSIRGVTSNVLFDPYSILCKFGKVLTLHMKDSSTVDGNLSDKEIYEKDMKLLEKCSVFVADVSNPSLGVGYTIAKAEQLQKRIICVSKKGQVSAMISGSQTIHFYNDEKEFVKILENELVPKIIVMIGLPGSGKTTIGKKFESLCGIKHISTGDILRNMTNDDPMNTIVRNFIDKGNLVPADIMIQIIDNVLKKNHQFVLDGYPPSKEDLMYFQARYTPDLVIYFECSDDTAIARQCIRNERSTDTKEMAIHRVKLFHEKIPSFEIVAKEWYPQSLMMKIDAEKDAESVWKMVSPPNTNGSFFYLPPFGNTTNSSRIHFHIDAESHQDLMDLLKEIHIQNRDLQGTIKVYPISHLKLGQQTNQMTVYSKMMNFHPINDCNNESFATGLMGDTFNVQTMKCVLSAIKKSGRKYMTEIEEYIYECESKPVFYDEIGLDISPLNKYSSNRIESPPFELHHGFDLAKMDKIETLPISLDVLMNKCFENGLTNGGWFIFKKNNFWAYRSNEFFHGTKDDAIKIIQKQTLALSNLLKEIVGTDVSVGSSVEIVHAIWQF